MTETRPSLAPRRALRAAAALVALAAAAGVTSALAQDVARYFPLEVGRIWTYHLKITTGAETRSIEYTTRVARTEAVDGLQCAVLESHSGERLLQVNWYGLDGEGRVVQPQRQNGARVSAVRSRQGDVVGAAGRMILDQRAIDALPEHTVWEWASADATSRGTVTLLQREKLRLRNFGELDCLVLLDEGTAAAADGRRATFERRFWLAPGLGVVQERYAATADGVRTESEATLIRHEAP